MLTSPKRKRTQEKISVVILGASPIYRMRTYGPAPLIKIDNKPLFEILTEQISLAFPNNEIILTIGYQADKLIKELPYNIHLVENHKFEETNLTEELRLGINNASTDKILIYNVTSIIDAESLKKIDIGESSVIVSKTIKSKNYVGIVNTNNFVSNFCYGLDNEWCEVAYITGHEFSLLKNIVNNPDRKRFFLFESLNLTIEKSGKFKIIEPPNLKYLKVEKPHENFNIK